MFYGRKKTIETIRKCLDSGKCVYINGPNGVGKSELIKWFLGKEDRSYWWKAEEGPVDKTERYLPDDEKKRVVVSVPNIMNGMDSVISGITQIKSFWELADDTILKKKLSELKDELDAMPIRVPKKLAEKIVTFYSKLGIRQMVMFVDEFEAISGLADTKESGNRTLTKKAALEEFLSELIDQFRLLPKPITVSIVMASRKSFEVFYGSEDTFSKTVKPELINLSGFMNDDLNRMFQNEYKEIKPSVLQEVYFYCGRHPDLLKKMRAALSLDTSADEVGKLIADNPNIDKVYSVCYEKLCEETSEGEFGLAPMFLELFDAGSGDKEKEAYKKQLLQKGFILDEGKTPYVDSTRAEILLGEMSEAYRERIKQYKTYVPISPYMLEYVKARYEKEKAQSETATVLVPVEAGGVAYEEPEAEKMISVSEEKWNRLQAENVALKSKVEDLGLFIQHIEQRDTELFAMALAGSANVAEKSMKLSLDSVHDIYKSIMKDVAEQMQQAKADIQKKQEEADRLARDLQNVQEALKKTSLSDEERAEYKRQCADLQAKCDASNKALEKAKEEAFDTVARRKYNAIFAEELTAEKVKEILSNTPRIRKPTDLTKIKKAIDMITQYGLGNELKLAVYMHGLFNDLSICGAMDYSVLTMLYSKMYEGFLKKAHLPVYQAVLPNEKVSKDSNARSFSAASENDVTIGSFASKLGRDRSNNPISTLATLQNYFSDRNRAENKRIASNNRTWLDYTDSTQWIMHIRNNVMHVGAENQSGNSSATADIKDRVLAMTLEKRLEKLLLLLFNENAIESIGKIREAFDP